MLIEGREVTHYLGDIYKYSTQDMTITFDAGITTTSWNNCIVTFASPDRTSIFEIVKANISFSSNTISFSLTQAQTAQLPTPYCLMMVNYTYSSGTKRNNSEEGYFNVFDNLHRSVI